LCIPVRTTTLKRDGGYDAWSFMNNPEGLEIPLDLQDVKSLRI